MLVVGGSPSRCLITRPDRCRLFRGRLVWGAPRGMPRCGRRSGERRSGGRGLSSVRSPTPGGHDRSRPGLSRWPTAERAVGARSRAGCERRVRLRLRVVLARVGVPRFQGSREPVLSGGWRSVPRPDREQSVPVRSRRPSRGCGGQGGRASSSPLASGSSARDAAAAGRGGCARAGRRGRRRSRTRSSGRSHARPAAAPPTPRPRSATTASSSCSRTPSRARADARGGGESLFVLDLRRRWQRVMRADVSREIEQLTGREVIGFMSDNHIDPDLAVDVFVLEPLPPATRLALATRLRACRAGRSLTLRGGHRRSRAPPTRGLSARPPSRAGVEVGASASGADPAELVGPRLPAPTTLARTRASGRGERSGLMCARRPGRDGRNEGQLHGVLVALLVGRARRYCWAQTGALPSRGSAGLFGTGSGRAEGDPPQIRSNTAAVTAASWDRERGFREVARCGHGR